MTDPTPTRPERAVSADGRLEVRKVADLWCIVGRDEDGYFEPQFIPDAPGLTAAEVLAEIRGGASWPS